MSQQAHHNAWDDVIVSSRIRLARNFQQVPFPARMDQKDALFVLDKMRQLAREKGKELGLDFLEMEAITPVDRQVLVEKHLISLEFYKEPLKDKGMLLGRDQTRSVMINEEDHLRIQCLLKGMQLETAYMQVSLLDDEIARRVSYAYDDKFGYLTGCPTNVGTGMRASVMMHLPVLAQNGYIQPALQTIARIGLTVRGLYGEGTQAQGHLFQVSNQVTLGFTEQDLIENLKVACNQLAEKERQAREMMMQTNRLAVEDALNRSLGLMTHARSIDSEEFLKLWSDIRLAKALGVVSLPNGLDLDAMMIDMQPGNLQQKEGQELSAQQRDVLRAQKTQQQLA